MNGYVIILLLFGIVNISTCCYTLLDGAGVYFGVRVLTLPALFFKSGVIFCLILGLIELNQCGFRWRRLLYTVGFLLLLGVVNFYWEYVIGSAC